MAEFIFFEELGSWSKGFKGMAGIRVSIFGLYILTRKESPVKFLYFREEMVLY